MKVLIIGRYKEFFPQNLMPFVLEQGEALKVQGCEVEYLAFKGSYLRAKSIRAAIDKYHPDLVHAHYGLCGIPAVLQRRVPVVTTFHNGETLNRKVNFTSSLFSLRASHVIYVAQHIYDKSIFKRKRNYSILPCGVNLEECVITDKREARSALGFNDTTKYILFGGAFSNLRKNFGLLAKAIELSGRGDIKCLEMKGLSREQISLLMSACDLFALPSKSEGSPQALKEAMACNCPVIATDIADVKHLLGDLPGHFIASFDPIEYSKVLSRALDFKGRTEGRKRIIELGLTSESVAHSIVDIYNKILD